MCQNRPERRKVGDTIRVLIYDEEGNEINPEDVDAEIQWYADSIEITGADEAEYDVLVGDVGVKLSACVTIDGEEYWTDQTAKVEKADGQIEIVAAEATAVNVIEVTLAEAVDIDDTTVALTKGTSEIPVTVDWADDNKGVTLTSATKLTKGTYTVTLTSEEDETNTDSEDVEIVDQYVDEIVITTDTALTSANKKSAYANYDVFDQYGQSIRTSTSITWAGSCEITPDKTTGKLTLKKNGGADWVYNEQIFVTGVNAKTGASVNKTLTVGTEQNLDTLEIAGFVKKGTSTIIQKLPKDFKENTYYLLFKPLDQNGTQMAASDLKGNDVTFVSNNVLVVKEVETRLVEKTVEGTTYVAAFVQPGIKVSDGGEVTITAIANRTGNQTEISMVVGEGQVVSSFVMSAPATIVADGDENVEIPFVATDAEGNEIKDFVTLAQQETFNTLSFNASDGYLTLKEDNDGTAKLVWSDALAYRGDAGWTQGQCTDGLERPISLTAIVVGGGTDNQMISVSDKRRPDGILSVDMDKAYVEGTTITFEGNTNKFEAFQFVDQYGKTIKGTKGSAYKYGDSTGFFAAASGNFTDTELKGYTFGVRVEYAGSEHIAMDATTTTTYLDGTTVATSKEAIINGANKVVYATKQDVESASTGEGFKFAVSKFKAATGKTITNSADWDDMTPEKYVETAVVDLSQIQGVAIKDLNKFYAGRVTTSEGVATGAGQINSDQLAELQDTSGTPASAAKLVVATVAGGITAGAGKNGAYNQEVKVAGTYNGNSVAIPAAYFTVTGSKIATDATGTGALGDSWVDALVTGGLKTTDLYDSKSSQGVSKDTTDTLTATLYNVSKTYTNGEKTIKAPITYNTLSATVDTTIAGWATIAPTTATAAAAAVVTTGQIPAETTVDAATAILTAANESIASFANKTFTVAGGTPTVTDIKTEVAAETNAITALITAATPGRPIFTTATKEITISDQDPSATKIDNLKESATLAPTLTEITNIENNTGIRADESKAITVKDQYGVTLAGAVITYLATDLAESATGYAENNLNVVGQSSTTLSVKGAERADTFTLTLKSGSASASCAVTVGADTEACIVNAYNCYTEDLVPVLEAQRIAGLG